MDIQVRRGHFVASVIARSIEGRRWIRANIKKQGLITVPIDVIDELIIEMTLDKLEVDDK